MLEDVLAQKTKSMLELKKIQILKDVVQVLAVVGKMTKKLNNWISDEMAEQSEAKSAELSSKTKFLYAYANDLNRFFNYVELFIDFVYVSIFELKSIICFSHVQLLNFPFSVALLQSSCPTTITPSQKTIRSKVRLLLFIKH